MNFRNILSYILFIFILPLLISCSESNPTTPQEEHFEATGVVLRNDTAIILKVCKNIFDDEYGNKLNLKVGEELILDINFTGEDCEEIGRPKDEEMQSEYIISDTATAIVSKSDTNDWQMKLKGLIPGNTTLEIRILHAGHADFKSPLLQIMVSE